jgi:hypothetical protein
MLAELVPISPMPPRSVRGMSGKPVDRGAQFAYGCGDWPTWR